MTPLFPFLPEEERYLVIDDTDESAQQILYVALDGLRLAAWRPSQEDEVTG
jgi:hypothetical protein